MVLAPSPLTAIAALVGGELSGDGTVSGQRRRTARPRGAKRPEHSCRAPNTRRCSQPRKAGIVLVDPEFRDVAGRPRARIIVKEPLEKLLALLPRLYPETSAGAGRGGNGAHWKQGCARAAGFDR